MHKQFREVVCVEACRTPYGRAGGALKDFSAMELGALAIKKCCAAPGKVKPGDVDYIFMGQVVPAGCGQIPGRQATILAGVPEYVPSITVNKVCSSGIKTIDLAFQMILLGRAEICIAGGQESMSNCPFVLPDMRWGAKMALPNGRVVDSMVYDGLWDAFITGTWRFMARRWLMNSASAERSRPVGAELTDERGQGNERGPTRR